MTADFIVIAIYIIVIVAIGLASSKTDSLKDYFLGGKNIPWFLAALSIVATETSTLTFISIPGVAYLKGVGFLQIAIGYFIGKMFVSYFLLPVYIKGGFQTAYHFLEEKSDSSSRRIISVIFIVTRLLADSIRLFATAIPLSLFTGLDYRISIVIIGTATFIYTYYGGIKSVVFADSVQFLLYIVCAVMGVVIIVNYTGKPIGELFNIIPAESLKIFSLKLDGGFGSFFGSYNIISGIIGGAFFAVASHGTDHLIVQRALSCKDERSAQKAMMYSGVIVFLQFALFLFLGLLIKVMLDGKEFALPDEIMPHFIINYIPPGFRGLMLAGIFAAAMSSLSSSINSISASTVLDVFNIDKRNISEEKKMKISKGISLFWTIVIVLIASLLTNTKSPLVELGLGIASITYGGMLAVFIQIRFFKSFDKRASFTGVAISIVSIILAKWQFNVFWPWYVPMGFLITIVLSYIIQKLGEK